MYVCVYVVSRSHKSHEWGLHNQSQQQQSCCKRSAYSKYVYYYMVLVQCINISTCRFLSCATTYMYSDNQYRKNVPKGGVIWGSSSSLYGMPPSKGVRSPLIIQQLIYGAGIVVVVAITYIGSRGGQGEKFHAFQNEYMVCFIKTSYTDPISLLQHR